MLGTRQLAAFRKAVAASTATWKVVVNEVPMQQYYTVPYDRWEGYAAERTRLLRSLQANARNVVFLTTDTHGNLVNEIRLRTLGGAPEGTGMWEVVTGPVATNTFSTSIDRLLGVPGGGARSRRSSSTPAPDRRRHALCCSRRPELRAGDGDGEDAGRRLPRRERPARARGDGTPMRAARPSRALTMNDHRADYPATGRP